MANSEDPDEMQHHAAFHQVLHCLLRLKQASGTEKHHNLENFTYDSVTPKVHNGQSDNLLHQYIWENPSEYKG